MADGENLLTGSERFLDTTKIVGELNVKPGSKVADFGCGSGYFTLELAKAVGENGKVYALDVQEPPLETIRAKAKASGFSNVETIRANLEVSGSSSLPEGSQDLVLLANILFQSTKKAEIIREAKRVLKSEGMLVVIDWIKGLKGFGPPDELRTDKPTIQALMVNDGFSFMRDVDTGQFHFGQMYKK